MGEQGAGGDDLRYGMAICLSKVMSQFYSRSDYPGHRRYHCYFNAKTHKADRITRQAIIAGF